MTNTNEETVIESDDTLQDAVVKMSDGNPGALTALTELIQDPDGFKLLMKLDMLGVRGPDIWRLYKDECGGDVECMVNKIRQMES